MPFFMIKSILGVAYILAGLSAVIAMLTLMGKTERTIGAAALRKTHKTAGYIFVILTLVISYMCIKYLAAAGDAIPLRAVLHGVLASALLAVIFLKLLIVRVYKNFARFAPAMGLTIFSIAFVVFSTSAGFYLVRTWCPVVMGESGADKVPVGGVDDRRATEMLEGVATADAEVGQEIYRNHCAGCHYADREDTRVGPGLKGLMTRERLASSGRTVTAATVADQIRNPVGSMPSFANRLSGEELEHLLAYLSTL